MSAVLAQAVTRAVRAAAGSVRTIQALIGSIPYMDYINTSTISTLIHKSTYRIVQT